MAIDVQCAQIVFEVCKLTIVTKGLFWQFLITIFKLGTMNTMLSSVMSSICTFPDAYKVAHGGNHGTRCDDDNHN